METTIVIAASLIGSIVSLFLFVDAMRDRWIVTHQNPPRKDLYEITFNRLVGEGISLLVQGMFLTSAVIFFANSSQRLREYAIMLLVSIPILLTVQSIYFWIRRRIFLSHVSESEDEGQGKLLDR